MQAYMLNAFSFPPAKTGSVQQHSTNNACLFA